MPTIAPPQLACRRLASFRLDPWEDAAAALRGAQACALGQHWRGAPEPGLRPATVRTGWTDDALIVLAELEDDDIFNPVTEFNAMSFMQGDVFEMFLRPAEQDAYCEFHVSPMNQKLQLRFPSAAAFRTLDFSKGIPAEWFVAGRQIESRVHVEADRRRWSVLAKIPADMVAESGRVGPGSRWLFSFSRYDYTRGAAEPVLSSSSPHAKLSFHRQEEWGALTFE